MKRILSVLISLFVVAASFSVCFSAFALKSTDVSKTRLGESETYYEYSAETKTLTISGSGDIPNMTNNEASQPWFNWRSDGSIERVVIEEGITRVGNYVFYQVCAPDISVPSSLKAVGNYAFAYNSGITAMELPFGVQSLGASTFENCINLESIVLPDSLLIISKNAFKQCYKLQSAKIPYSVQSIGSYGFYRCSALESVEFESMSSSVRIGDYCFMSCPRLTELSVPLNAQISAKYSFGYNDSKVKYDNISMKIYSGSDAMAYAAAKSIPYTLLDTIPLEIGVLNTNNYIEETVNYEYKYTFTPPVTQKYNIYSTGDADLRAVISENGSEIQSADDISKNNLNFCLSCELEAGKEYLITVTSVKSEGEYSVIVYPDEIISLDIKGSLSFSAEEGSVSDGGQRYFDITDDMLRDFVLTVNFAGGFIDRILYENKYFNNRIISIADKQSDTPFTCGKNSSYIAIGEVEGVFDVDISHSYGEEFIDMTLDDDGYTLYTCILCSYSYKDNFVPTTAVTVSGRAVIAEKPDASHGHNIPYPYASFNANDRTYHIDENGNWSLRTFGSLDLIFENEYGKNVSVHIDVDGRDVDFGTIAFEGYDFNGDSIVNAKDYAIFLKQKQQTLGKDYWQFAVNFIRVAVRCLPPLTTRHAPR